MKEKYDKYKNYPEGSAAKKLYDSIHLPLQVYLSKYYESYNIEKWNNWISNYVTPAYEPSRHHEMVENFGYVSIEKHDFEAQQNYYEEIKKTENVDDDVAMFIGFMAGCGFFRKWNLKLNDWLTMKNWFHPYWDPEDNQRTISEILEFDYGQNYLRANLTELPFWKR